MPLDPRRKIAKFQFGLLGLTSKENPSLLPDGSFRNLSNCEVTQENSLSTRAGKKLLGSTAGIYCYMIRKAVIQPTNIQPQENPSLPSLSPRYIGIGDNTGGDLWRTTTYGAGDFTEVASLINTNLADESRKAFSLAEYAAGETGGPWVFIASPNAMLKDSGANPYTTLRKWGIIPAAGVATATAKLGAAGTIAVTMSYGYPNWATGLVVTLASPAAINDFDVIVFTGVVENPPTSSGVLITSNAPAPSGDPRTHINDAAGWSIRVGMPASGGVGLDPDFDKTKVFRIFDNAGNPVTGTWPAGPYTAGGTVNAALLAIPGNVDGGAGGSPAGSQPFDYRYVYSSTETGNVGNPSQIMLADSTVVGGVPIAANKRQITVQGYGIDVAVYPGLDTIKIYRRGGTSLGLWRLVGSVANPGAGVLWTFTDNLSDLDLVDAPIMETDNDPPVPSSVPKPITGTLAVIAAAGRQSVALTLGTLASVTPGTLMHLFFDNPEDVVIETISGGGTGFTAYFQHAHSAGAAFQIDAITGQPCNLAIGYQQFVLVAGDPNNPHIIYRSKGDQPESFPLITADQSVASVACGNPSNPIMNIYEFRGQIVSLNLYGIFETMIFGGSLINAAQVAAIGTVGMRANCKTNTEIWFLHVDGVWSWDGSTARKRSELIDPIFHGQYYNGIAPLDFSQPQECVMESRRQQIYLRYIDLTGAIQELICEPMFNDRWRKYDVAAQGLDFMYAEPDTESMIEATATAGPTISFAISDQYQYAGGGSQVNYTADYFTGAWTPPGTIGGAGGASIPFDIRLPWFDMGSPTSEKLFEEVILELDSTGTSSLGGATTLTVEMLTDFFDTPVSKDTQILPIAGGNRNIWSLLPGQEVGSGGHIQAYGEEARAISYHIYGTAWPAQITFYSLTVVYQDTEMETTGGPSDWSDLGYKHDKRLYQMVVTCDTGGVSQTIVLDTMTGIGGLTYNAEVQTFVIVSDSAVKGPSRAMKTFPIKDGVIAKLVRVRPYSTAPLVGTAGGGTFKIFNVEFTQVENYPPDISLFSPWEDGGYGYLKYANQLDLDVDTNGVAVSVQIQTDGGTTVQTIPVTTTGSDRIRNLTLLPNLAGRKWRWFVDPAQSGIAGGTGKFQVFSAAFKFQQADKGEVVHSGDWDSLSWEHDKRLHTITIEADNSGNPDVTMQLDVLNGIGGGTLVSNVAQFVITGGRSKRTYPIPTDTIAKLIRVFPIGTPTVSFKSWRYSFNKTDLPPDTVLDTDWMVAKSPNDQNPSWLWIDADSQGVAATVILQNEAGTVMTVAHTGTLTGRKSNYAIPVDKVGKMWRITAAPGVNGKFQNYDWGFDRWQPVDQASGADPCEVLLWTPWQTFGWPYETIARNLTMILDTGGVACSVALQTDEAGTVETFSVTTTYTTRQVVLPCNPNLIGKSWRLLLTPGNGGKSKLWSWGLDVLKEPAAVNFWTSYESNLGFDGFKFIKDVWLNYQSTQTITFTIVSDTGTFSITLPAHAGRTTEHFNLPAVWGAGLDKSVIYKTTITSSGNFKIYANSQINWIPWNADNQAGFQHFMISTEQQLAVA